MKKIFNKKTHCQNAHWYKRKWFDLQFQNYSSCLPNLIRPSKVSRAVTHGNKGVQSRRSGGIPLDSRIRGNDENEAVTFSEFSKFEIGNKVKQHRIFLEW